MPIVTEVKPVQPENAEDGIFVTLSQILSGVNAVQSLNTGPLYLPIVVQFWDADEEFPGQLMIKWDRNILQYMHFETTFYATGCLLQRIRELMDTAQ